MKLILTTSNNPDFEKLVAQLDAYLAILDGEDYAFYSQFNKSSLLKNALIVYENETPIEIGAYKEYDQGTAEIKRMFVHPDYRGKGIATTILTEIESWAKEVGYTNFILETSPKLTSAVALYQKMGYIQIPNFGQYIGVENSICMKKEM